MALTPVTTSDDGTTAVVEYRDSVTGKVVVRSSELSSANTAGLALAATQGAVQSDIDQHLNQLITAWGARTVKPGNAAAQTVGPDIVTQWRAVLLMIKMAQAYKANYATNVGG